MRHERVSGRAPFSFINPFMVICLFRCIFSSPASLERGSNRRKFGALAKAAFWLKPTESHSLYPTLKRGATQDFSAVVVTNKPGPVNMQVTNTHMGGMGVRQIWRRLPPNPLNREFAYFRCFEMHWANMLILCRCPLWLWLWTP